MLDLILINPVGYRGSPRRGPYELTSIREQVREAGLAAELLDFQEAVGRGMLPFPRGFVVGAESRLADVRARVALITFRTSAGPWALSIAQRYRRLFADSFLVAFAPRIEERLRRFMAEDATFDALCLGRPEQTILELVASVKASGIEGAGNVPGLLIRGTGGQLRTTERSVPPPPMDGSRPAEPWFSDDRSIAAIHVGRGCPDRCTFCSAHLGPGAQPEYRSPELAAQEAERAYSRLNPSKSRMVMLETENLTSNREWIKSLRTTRDRAGMSFQWGAYGRIDHVDQEMLHLLKSSGCCFLFMGIETGSRRLQKVLGKHFDLTQVLPRLHALHHSGIATQSSFIFGIPGETNEDFATTAQLMAEITWVGGYVDWTPLRIEAGTAMEHLVKGHRTRLLTNCELYRDLKEAGEDPEAVHPEVGYRMYGLNQEGLNIETLVPVADSWRHLLISAPLTSYALHRGLGLETATLLHALGADRPTSAEGWLRWCLALTGHLPDSVPFIRDLMAYELGISPANGVAPRHNLGLVYSDLRRKPANIPRAFTLPWWRGTRARSSTAGEPVLGDQAS